ncbi:5'-3' exonuclease H3TH domain-containing protein [Buchnera aphidicola]|uniref:5'-3' exonuclease H3TH domain-containing protein n=1 Tax=Buchnera aphidicola TaxID=9 RepID=UPI001F214682|nr:5'-3' exonuclease H3TH domain-containing protein [Buchnera aphidicola]
MPGVPKIGKKTALFLIKQFSSIENIYCNIQKIPLLPFRNAKNVTIQLKNYKKLAFLSYKLVKIKIDIPINITSKDMFLNTCHTENLFKFFNTIF